MIHKAIKSNAKKQNENKNQVPNKKANYVINYDKNLTPESVQKFEKEPMFELDSPEERKNVKVEF